ncbi:aldehyde-activating protein [Kaistia sp. 32K]|uniref:GFA family protein n=1 Tax=Kaistia sp. 32K TaxID=2795690 RepID=UPI001916125D|nr:GFA family protein [Kaistia sp. 32K]BCP54049.1 aldehyde-activating protein [Kaistia sp. 32K]
MTAGGEIHSGACLCGAVTYRVAGPLAPVVGCHCTMCRRQTGHFLASTTVAASDVTISGGDSLRWYPSSETVRRGFCGACGSVLFWERIGRPEIAIAMGGFDKPTGVRWEKHIFVADKGDYYAIEDGAPAYDRRQTSTHQD